MSSQSPIRKQFSPLPPYEQHCFTWYRATGQITHRIGRDGLETPLATNHGKESQRQWFIELCMNHLDLDPRKPEERALFPALGKASKKKVYRE